MPTRNCTRDLIEAAVQRGHNAMPIWQDLVSDYGFAHSYQSVKRFVNKLQSSAVQEAGGMRLWLKILLEAYRQSFETLRYYGNLRFAALTAFIAISGGLFAIALKKPREDKVVLFSRA